MSSTKHGLLLAAYATVMTMCAITISVLVATRPETVLDAAPRKAGLESLPEAGPDPIWVEIDDVTVFDRFLIQDTGVFSESPDYYFPLLPAGDTAGDDFRAAPDNPDAHRFSSMSEERQRIVRRAFARSRVLVVARAAKWKDGGYDLQDGVTATATGALVEAPADVLRSVGSMGIDSGGLVVVRLEPPLRRDHCDLIILIAALVLVATTLHGRRLRLFGPHRKELYEALPWSPQPLVELLIVLGAPVDRRDGKGRTTLHAAALYGHVRVARRLLASGLDLEARDDDGDTPLCVANDDGPFFRRSSIVSFLIEAGADVDSPGRFGRSPLHRPARDPRVDDLRRLLDAGADPNVADENGMTPVHSAAGWGRPDTLALLIDRGGEPDIPNRVGDTPLHVAAYRLHEECVGLLLEHGADPRRRNANGHTPGDLASGRVTTSICYPFTTRSGDGVRSRIREKLRRATGVLF